MIEGGRTNDDFRREADKVGFAIVEKVVALRDLNLAVAVANDDLNRLIEHRKRLLEWVKTS